LQSLGPVACSRRRAGTRCKTTPHSEQSKRSPHYQKRSIYLPVQEKNEMGEHKQKKQTRTEYSPSTDLGCEVFDWELSSTATPKKKKSNVFAGKKKE
jgi:hypothetical protein